MKYNFTKKEIEALKEVARERIIFNNILKDKKVSTKKMTCLYLIKENGRCNSKYWKGKKCNKKKCPWKNHGSYAMAVTDAPNRLRRNK